MWSGIRYRSSDGQVTAAIVLGDTRDKDIQVVPAGEALLAVPIGHDVFNNPDHWRVVGEDLVVAPPVPPGNNALPGIRQMIEVIIDELNVLRQLHGLGPLIVGDFIAKAKAKGKP